MPDLAIGEIARLSGLNASTIRYYERIGVLAPPPRRSGRRCYDLTMVPRLSMLARARNVGSPIKQMRALAMAEQQSGDLDAVIAEQMEGLETKLAQLQGMRVLLELLRDCPRDGPNCCPAGQAQLR